MLEAILFGLLVAVVAMLISLEWQERRFKLPPGPKGIPVVGNLFQLMYATMKGEAPFVTFSKWAFKYGHEGISYARFGTVRVAIVSDAKLAQQMCVRMADNFSSRPSGLFVARVLKDKGIVCNNGPSWKAHRMFIQQEFRKFGFARQSIELPIQQVADELILQLKKVEGIPHNPHAEFATASYNIIWNVISGTKFDWDDPFLINMIHNLETNLEAMELVGAHNYVLVLTLIQLLRHNPVILLALFMERLTYFKKLIADHKSNMDDDHESMIYHYLEQIKDKTIINDEQLSSQMSESQLLFLVSDLFIAGGETTITTLRWATLCLAVYTEAQDRIRQEIMDNLGPNATPSYTHRAQLPYLEAFLHEVLRYCGVTPGMWRTTTADCKVGDYDIPKDTWIMLHFWAMANQESTWPEAKLFKPERFLDAEGKFQKSDNLAAFSTGRRQCPGEALAKTEIFTLLSNVLQKYRIDLAEEHDWKTLPEGTFGVTYTPPPFRVVFRRIESL